MLYVVVATTTYQRGGCRRNRAGRRGHFSPRASLPRPRLFRPACFYRALSTLCTRSFSPRLQYPASGCLVIRPTLQIYIFISSLSFAELTKDVRTSALPVCNAVTRPCYRLGYSPAPETRNFSIFLTNVDYVSSPLSPPLFLFRDEHEFIMQTALKLFYKHLVSFRKKLYQTTLSFLRFKMNFESQRSGFDRESLRQFNNFNFKIRAKERGDIRSKKNKRVNLLKSFRKFNLLTRTPESKKINVFIRGNCGRKNVSIVLIKVVKAMIKHY